MCGILGVFGYVGSEQDLRRLLLTAMKRLRHRGPDWSGLHIQYYASSPGKVNGFAHERLSIVDPLGGAQPLLDTSQRVVLCVNGEIFNHKQLRSELSEYAYTTHSDCEVILPGYLRDKEKFVSKLRGQFSFILSDSANDTYVVARDAIGVCPLYYGVDTNGAMWFSSEMKVLEMSCQSYKVFPPGHVYVRTKDAETWTQYYSPVWWDEAHVPAALPLTEDGAYSSVDYAALRNALIDSVKKRLMCDVPFGVLLSGGLDSSLVASIVTRLMKEGSFCEGEWFGRLHSFSIGLPDSPDLKAARLVAKFLGTKHYEMTFTLQEAKDALRDVIYHLETYDITTIRASTPMYLMSRKIKSMGVKMVLSGEGADEVFGGYLYFHKAPNKEEFQAELVRKLKSLHLYDCLRADKSTMAWGLEARVPFLDTDFLDVAMAIDPAAKLITPGHMEKYVLRKAFDTPDNPYLPESVLWRQKEQFSDGVGYGWIDCLRDLANIQVTDVMFGHRSLRFPYNTPTTKEGYMFRDIFEQLFHNPCGVVTVPGGPSIACSTPTAIRWAKEWENAADPSGRAILSVHVSHKRKANSDESDQQDKRVKT